MKAYALIAADLFAVVAVTFMVALGVLAPLVNSEVLSYIEQTQTDKKSDVAAPDAKETVLLEALYVGNGGTRFVLTSKDKQGNTFRRYQNLVVALQKERPQDIRIRIDRRVPSGVYQDILLDAGKLNIRVWQANEAR